MEVKYNDSLPCFPLIAFADGVYAVLLKVGSEEGGLSIGKKVNMVVNRDIAQKIQLVKND